MPQHKQPGTNYLADQWLAALNRGDYRNTDEARAAMEKSFRSYNGTVKGAIVENGVKKGVRYLFADTSFADFYFEAHEKGAVFTGIGGHLDEVN